MRNKSFYAVILCLVIGSTTVFGEIKTNASLELKTVSESNIYLGKTDEQSTTITSFIPGLNFLATGGQSKVGIDYAAEILNYSLSASTNNATNQSINVLLDFTFPVGLSLKLMDGYKDTSDAPSSEFVKRIKRTQNNLSGDIGYKFGRVWSASVLFSQINHAYSQDEYKAIFDRTESESGLVVYYGFSPKTSVLLEYDSGVIAYDKALNLNDSTYSNVKLGLKGKLTPKTAGILKIGSQSRKYDVQAEKDASTSILGLTSITEFSKMTSLKLSADRNFMESTFSSNLNYLATSITVELGQKIGKKVSVSVNSRYEMDDYDTAVLLDEATGAAAVTGVLTKRSDTNTLSGLGVKYSISEWLTANLGYTTKGRSSNFNSFNYTDTLTNVSIKAIF